MSFDLAVWHSPIPEDVYEAQKIYEQICEAGLQPNILSEKKIASFLNEVLKIYPALEDLDEKDLDNPERAVWSDTPRATMGGVIFSIRWSVVDVVADFIEERAHQYDLVVYDPQESYVITPG